MNWYKIAKYRGLYNTDEGNAHRNSNRAGQDAAWQERLDENDTIEGPMVQTLSRMFKEKNWDQYNKYVDKLRQEGYSKDRIDSMIRRSMANHKL